MRPLISRHTPDTRYVYNFYDTRGVNVWHVEMEGFKDDEESFTKIAQEMFEKLSGSEKDLEGYTLTVESQRISLSFVLNRRLKKAKGLLSE